MKPEEHWQKLAPRFRDTSTDPSEEKPPPGFATRIVALSLQNQKRPNLSLLSRFRNWSLATAGATALALLVLFNLQEPQTQFIPLPELDLPTPPPTMTHSLKDSLLIGAALITILGCGFGLGRLAPRDPAPVAPTAPPETIGDEILSSLRTSLDLTEEQEAKIAPELESLGTEILDSRRHALLRYYQGLLKFHTDIAPKLNPRQQSLLEANRKLLEKEFQSRFPAQS